MDNEISIVPFRFKYYNALISMLESQNYAGIADIKMKTLPKIGYMALYNNTAVAAGFLRRVEGNVAQLDGLTSNAYLGSIIRNAGINAVVKALLDEGKRLKLYGIYATTAEQSILNRAAELGFQIIPQTIIGLKLK